MEAKQCRRNYLLRLKEQWREVLFQSTLSQSYLGETIPYTYHLQDFNEGTDMEKKSDRLEKELTLASNRWTQCLVFMQQAIRYVEILLSTHFYLFLVINCIYIAMFALSSLKFHLLVFLFLH